MIYSNTGIDTFYFTEEQLKDSPSRKDGIDETTETNLRIYGCDLIQQSGILLGLPQAVMATGQVFFHRFYSKKSFARFNVKRVAASCVFLASKHEEIPIKGKHVIEFFHRMECRRENLPIEHLNHFSENDLHETEMHLLKEMGFVCYVEHPHKFISIYLATLETPPELVQEAWNLANDSLRTTLCVRFKSEVVACGVVYAAARRFQVPLPENSPWWEAFDTDKSGIDQVCSVLAHLYRLPKAHYIAVCKEEGESFATSNKNMDSPAQPAPKEGLLNSLPVGDDSLIEAALGKVKVSKKSDDETKSLSIEDVALKLKGEHRIEVSEEKNKLVKERGRERERLKVRKRDRGRDSNGECEREKRSRRSKDIGGCSDKSRHHAAQDRSDYYDSYSNNEKDRHRHWSYS